MQKGDATRERIKQASLGLFHQKGYKNTTISHVLEDSGIKKGTFYFHYPSKEKLAVEVLNRAITTYNEAIDSAVMHESPSEQILDMIAAIVNYHLEDNTTKGCIFGNMALEMGKNGTEVADFVEKVFEKWIARFEGIIIQAVEQKEIELKESAQAFARTILALIQGGLLLSKISGNPDSLKNCQQTIISLLDERKI